VLSCKLFFQTRFIYIYIIFARAYETVHRWMVRAVNAWTATRDDRVTENVRPCRRCTVTAVCRPRPELETTIWTSRSRAVACRLVERRLCALRPFDIGLGRVFRAGGAVISPKPLSYSSRAAITIVTTTVDKLNNFLAAPGTVRQRRRRASKKIIITINVSRTHAHAVRTRKKRYRNA